VLFLWNADDVEPGEKTRYRKYLGVGKQRNGPLNTMRFLFEAQTNAFFTPSEDEWKAIGDLHKPKEGEDGKKKKKRYGDDY
jgi:hypothetical protein